MPGDTMLTGTGFLPAQDASLGAGGGFRSKQAAFLQALTGRRSSVRIQAPWASTQWHGGQAGMGRDTGDLPNWVAVGECVGYLSKSTGRVMEVFVEKVSKLRREVTITFAEDRNSWKTIPFQMILNPGGPLVPLGPMAGQADKEEHRVEAAKDDVHEHGPAVPHLVSSPLVGSQISKEIADKSITASSYYMNNPRHGLGQMWRVRLANTDTAWRAAVDDAAQCVQFDLGGLKCVTKVQTKGCFTDSYWVTRFELSYTNDGSHWTRLATSFLGNTAKDTLAESEISPPIKARMVRLHPTAWHEHVSLRAELLGFEVEEPTAIVDDEPSPAGPAAAGKARSRSPRRR